MDRSKQFEVRHLAGLMFGWGFMAVGCLAIAGSLFLYMLWGHRFSGTPTQSPEFLAMKFCIAFLMGFGGVSAIISGVYAFKKHRLSASPFC